MIIYKKYIKKEVSGRVKTTLEAKLRFAKEVAPIIRDNLKNIMYSKQSLIFDYLRRFEEITYDPSKKSYTDDTFKNRNLTIKERPLKLGIDVKVSSFQDLEEGEMLNLNDLNNFIITGEYPKR